jgi:hypothetical protein
VHELVNRDWTVRIQKARQSATRRRAKGL